MNNNELISLGLCLLFASLLADSGKNLVRFYEPNLVFYVPS
jgi:hypothetical protein